MKRKVTKAEIKYLKEVVKATEKVIIGLKKMPPAFIELASFLAELKGKKYNHIENIKGLTELKKRCNKFIRNSEVKK